MTATTRRVVTAELTGYKIVGPDYGSLLSPPLASKVYYPVGSTQQLGDDYVVPCERGLHFCPRALDCLQFAEFYDELGNSLGRRLIRVVVPVGAVVATDDGGFKYAASVLRVDADVTDNIDALLTGTTSHGNHRARASRYFRAALPHRIGGPAFVRRIGNAVTKIWLRDGVPYDGHHDCWCAVRRDKYGMLTVCTALHPTVRVPVVDAARQRELTFMLDERETFEQ
jgi:hypothetical protein